MNFAPELKEPVFTEQVAVVEDPAVEVTRTAMVTPVEIATPVRAIEPESAAPIEVAEIQQPAPDRLIWFVTGSLVNVRSGPSTNTEVMGKVLYGDAAEIISDPESDWVRIRIEGAGVEGFVMKRFMTDIDPLG